MNITDEMVRDGCAAALVALLRAGVGHDVQEMLVYGDGRGTIAPGAVQSAMRAALLAVAPAIVEAERERARELADEICGLAVTSEICASKIIADRDAKSAEIEGLKARVGELDGLLQEARGALRGVETHDRLTQRARAAIRHIAAALTKPEGK